MLNIENITPSFPELVHQKKAFMLREYLQYKILESIFNSPYSDKLVFLGGTAIRIAYNSQRFSEDIDFDNLGLTFEDFTYLGEYIKNDLEKEGYIIELRHIQKGAFHCYIKFPELLFNAGISPLKEEKILIQIDTVPQNFEYAPRKHFINKFDVFTQINVTPIDLLLAQKFYAAFSRKRLQGRDFYDIIFLLSQNAVPNYLYLERSIGVKNGEQLKEYVREKSSVVDFDALVDNLKIFLFHPEKSKEILHFPEFISQLSL